MGKSVQKPVVFISHISEEREIAVALKALLESSFVGMMDVFVSSDPKSIHLGAQWLEKISAALKRCAVEIAIASPVSVRRPWINFEVGAGWVKDIPVIPLCHSGMNADKLPAPLNTFQGAVATEEDKLKLILPLLAEALGSGIPNVDFSTFIAVVKNYEDTTAKSVAISQELLIPESDGLAAHEKVTLEEAGELLTSPNSLVYFNSLSQAVSKNGFQNIASLLATKMLERKGLMELIRDEDYNGNEDWYVRITDEGWLWLEKNSRLLRDPPSIAYGHSEVAPSQGTPSYGVADDDVPF